MNFPTLLNHTLLHASLKFKAMNNTSYIYIDVNIQLSYFKLRFKRVKKKKKSIQLSKTRVSRIVEIIFEHFHLYLARVTWLNECVLGNDCANCTTGGEYLARSIQLTSTYVGAANFTCLRPATHCIFEKANEPFALD